MSGFIGVLAATTSGRVDISGTLALDDQEFSPTNATASVSFLNNGTITYVGNGSTGDSTWFEPSGATPGNNYYVSLTLDSGNLWTSGAASGTGVALTSTRTWSWSTTANGSKTAAVTVRFATDSGMTNVVDSAPLILYVERIV